jgi:hypothetical protein
MHVALPPDSPSLIDPSLLAAIDPGNVFHRNVHRPSLGPKIYIPAGLAGRYSGKFPGEATVPNLGFLHLTGTLDFKS